MALIRGLQSNSFDASQKRFKRVILNIADGLSLKQTKKLLSISENNNQIYQSFGLKAKIRAISEKYESEIVKADYPTIFPE